MAFVEQEDILSTFEGLTRHLLKEIRGVDVASIIKYFFKLAYQSFFSGG